MLHPDKSLQTPWKCAQLGLLIFPLLPAAGICILLLAIGWTWRQQYNKIIRRPVNWVLAALSGWLAIASCFAFRPVDAFLGLFNFLPFFGVFAAFGTLIKTPAQLRRLAQILVITSLPVVILGLGQLFLGWAYPEQWKDILGALGCAIAPGGNPPSRMSSVFAYANLLAGYLVIVFILSLGLWIENFQETGVRRQESGGRRWGDEEVGRWGDLTSYTQHNPPITPSPYPPIRRSPSPLATRLFLTVAVIGNFVALILTNSRNAWAIAVFAAIAFAVYQGWRWLLAGVSAIACSVVLAAFGPEPIQRSLRLVIPSYFWQRLTDQLYPNRPTVSLRSTQWQFAWELTQQRPWTGWGLRNFQPLYEAQMHAWFGHPHNLFLMLTAETGIPATLVFCGWVSWIFYQGFRLLLKWSKRAKTERMVAQERLIFFSFLLAFFACVLFNTVDVTIFDLRLNTLSWLLLSAISGVIYHQRDSRFEPYNEGRKRSPEN